MRTTILVVDDDPGIVGMLKRSLTYEGYDVIIAYNGDEAIQAVQRNKPNLVILDIMLPKLDGWQACRGIRQLDSYVPIIMLTAQDEVENRIKGLDLGADDYVVKPFHLDELIARVRAQLRRIAKDDDEQSMFRYQDLSANKEQRRAWRGNRLLDLKGKEYDLFLLLIQHPEQVLSKEQIIEQVWGFDYEGESNVVEVYIATLRQKLEKQGEPRLIHTVRGIGYVLRSE